MKKRTWEDIRQQGLANYIWKVGIQQWGLIMCCFFVGTQTAKNPENFIKILLINIPTWTIAGVIFGAITWHIAKWQRTKNDTESNN